MPLSEIRTIDNVPGPDLNTLIRATADRLLLEVDLDFNGVETQHSTHALHPYIAAINPPLARKLIETYTPPGGRILDPFCGGGGVLVEAIGAGRAAVGLDINPLATIISAAKTRHFQYGVLRQAYEVLQERAASFIGTSVAPDGSYLAYWFTPSCLRALAALSKAVSQTTEGNLKTVFQTILSATARDVMLTYRGEVRLRRLEPKDLLRFKPDVFVAFGKRAELAIQRISELPIAADVEVRLVDAKKTPYEDNSFDAVICSPPYADDTNGVGYFQFSKYLLLWLGWTGQEIADCRQTFLGGNHKVNNLQPPASETLRRALNIIQPRSERHSSVVTSFYDDYLACLREMFRVSRNWVIIVIGNRVISRTAIDNGQVTYELCNSFGGELHDYYTRSIRKKRIKDLGGDGGGTTAEHILIFRKTARTIVTRQEP